MSTRYIGLDGESIARDYLTGIGARIIDNNVKLGGGEIDIIAMIDGICVFIEVKRRSNALHGRPAEAVTPSKMRKIIRAASLYAAMHDLSDWPLRFDVIEILPGEINHIPAAFDLSSAAY
jgi:putative endonuclease